MRARPAASLQPFGSRRSSGSQRTAASGARPTGQRPPTHPRPRRSRRHRAFRGDRDPPTRAQREPRPAPRRDLGCRRLRATAADGPQPPAQRRTPRNQPHRRVRPPRPLPRRLVVADDGPASHLLIDSGSENASSASTTPAPATPAAPASVSPSSTTSSVTTTAPSPSPTPSPTAPPSPSTCPRRQTPRLGASAGPLTPAGLRRGFCSASAPLRHQRSRKPGILPTTKGTTAAPINSAASRRG